MDHYLKRLQGKNVLVTGGTGTVGKELVRKLLPFGPEVIRVFSRDENKQFFMRDEFREFPNVRFLIGDVRDRQRLERAMEDVDVVFHLAALKHVESCEYNPFEAIRTNIEGTQNVIDSALSAEVGNVVFSSTDKAVNPSNAMGTSKLMAEKLIVAANYYKGRHRTIFNSVRFGNVLASSGSVVPTFISRIREGSPIDVTDYRMSRFVTTFDEAVENLVKAAVDGRGGEVFIRRMPVINIHDLAQVLIDEFASLYGFSNVKIREIGCRAGEKLYEELITEEESARTVIDGNYLVLLPSLGGAPKNPAGQPSFRIGAYTSRDEVMLSKDQLRKLMYQEHLFSNPQLMSGSLKHCRLDSSTLRPSTPVGGTA
jgi:FlaA1/EpsC-like NDP-sugar epimerase